MDAWFLFLFHSFLSKLIVLCRFCVICAGIWWFPCNGYDYLTFTYYIDLNVRYPRNTHRHTHSLARSFARSLIHSLTQSLTHPPTYSITPSRTISLPHTQWRKMNPTITRGFKKHVAWINAIEREPVGLVLEFRIGAVVSISISYS